MFSDRDIDFPFSIGNGAISISVMLSGQMEFSDYRRRPLPEYSIYKPTDLVHVDDGCEGYGSIKGGVLFRGISVILDGGVLLEMVQDEGEYAPLVEALEKKNQSYLINRFTPSPQTQLIAKQMMDCSYRNHCRKLFLESKALELVATTLHRMERGTKPSSIPLSRGDVERLNEAKRLLLLNYEEPPTIKKLARAVGINEFKLKKGFREVFGCTPFQALRSHRMEEARSLLEGADMTVGEVACCVGYTNASHFIVAFRNHFGVTPGSLLTHDRHHRIA